MTDFARRMRYLAGELLQKTPFTVGEWQSKNVSRVRQFDTYEMTDVSLCFDDLPGNRETLTKMLDPYPNFDWADEHFNERVSGIPMNPAPSHERWPWGRHNGNHQDGPAQVFSHTYPERMWPKHAGDVTCHQGYVMNGFNEPTPVDKYGQADSGQQVCEGRRGVRFHYGDLDDVINLLARSPHTRQAFLPLWFPEDTGAVHRQRVPCTLGYHFMVRGGMMSCRYYMRSCDLVRHFADDVYLAGRLLQWVCDQVNRKQCPHYDDPTSVGCEHEHLGISYLRMYIASLHAFAGEKYTLERMVNEGVPSKQN